jgi:hypothetical protein
MKRRFPCWVVSLLVALPPLVSVSLPAEPVTDELSWGFGCFPTPWSQLTFSQKMERRFGPFLERRHMHFAPSRPPFPRVI